MKFNSKVVLGNFETVIFDVRMRPLKFLISLAVCCTAPVISTYSEDRESKEPTFVRDILPIFQERCAKCHTKKKRGGLSLNTREAVLKGGKSGKVVIPGQSENSLLYRMVLRDEGVKPMPRKRAPLDEKEIESIRKWIVAGAQ